MEEEYEKNPLLRHFYVYMQVFLSQALEPGFLDEVRKTNGKLAGIYQRADKSGQNHSIYMESKTFTLKG